MTADDTKRALCDCLLSDSPDMGRLEQITEGLDASPSVARRMVYDLILRLNAEFFPPVTQLELIHTDRCNLACTYCFEGSYRGTRRIPVATARSAIDVLFDYSGDEQALSILHFGGEPTLNFHSIRVVTAYAEQKARDSAKTVHFAMTTNGTLLTEESVRYLADHNVRVMISIDGLKASHDRHRTDRRGHGSFERTMRGLRELKKVYPSISAKMTVMPANVPDLLNDVRGLYAEGVNSFAIGYATGVRWSAEEIECYARELKELFGWYRSESPPDLTIEGWQKEGPTTGKPMGGFGCRAGRGSIAVDVDGRVMPCSKVVGLGPQSACLALGDVRYGLTHLRNRLELVKCERLRAACASLGIETDYPGGCFADNYDENGDPFVPGMQSYTFAQIEHSLA